MRARRLPARAHRAVAARARPRLPDGRVPEPRGEGRDGPRARARARASRPTSCSRTIRTPIGCASRSRRRRRRLSRAHRRPGRRAARRLPARGRRRRTSAWSRRRSCRRSCSAYLAKQAGADYRETLTGFKWIGNAAMDYERDHHGRFVMGYEEALGYSVGPLVRDKDGVSACVIFAELVAWNRARGRTRARAPRRHLSPRRPVRDRAGVDDQAGQRGHRADQGGDDALPRRSRRPRSAATTIEQVVDLATRRRRPAEVATCSCSGSRAAAA